MATIQRELGTQTGHGNFRPGEEDEIVGGQVPGNLHGIEQVDPGCEEMTTVDEVNLRLRRTEHHFATRTKISHALHNSIPVLSPCRGDMVHRENGATLHDSDLQGGEACQTASLHRAS